MSENNNKTTIGDAISSLIVLALIVGFFVWIWKSILTIIQSLWSSDSEEKWVGIKVSFINAMLSGVFGFAIIYGSQENDNDVRVVGICLCSIAAVCALCCAWLIYQCQVLKKQRVTTSPVDQVVTSVVDNDKPEKIQVRTREELELEVIRIESEYNKSKSQSK